MAKAPGARLPVLVDMGDTRDVFLSGIARVERLPGNCLRFVCYVDDEEDGRPRRTIVLRAIWPASLLPKVMRQIAEAITAADEPISFGESKSDGRARD